MVGIGTAENMGEINEFPVGSRIVINNTDHGTVRYTGNVAGHTGEWVGVEWDDPSRGKHNGTVNGVHYFTTRHNKSGSFIRPGKISQSRTLEETIEQRYIQRDKNPVDETLMKEAQQYLGAALFEIVGMEKIMDKQSRPNKLIDISVSHSLAASAGNLGALTNLVSIDLTATLVWNWPIVADIVGQLPALNYLNLAQNRLVRPTETDIAAIESSFRHLKTINLRQCGLADWQEVLHIARLWPNIQSLALQDNGIAKLSPPDCRTVFKSLQSLDLHMNQLADFSEILHLSQIGSLQTLLLMDNGIRRIEFPAACEADEKLRIFPALSEINLRSNPIEDDRHTFNELDKLPALTSLCQSPRPGTAFEDMHSCAVAMIRQLSVLNKSTILREQRRGAEYDLLKMYGWEWIQSEEDPPKRANLIQRCRVYPSLVHKHGALEESLVRPVQKQSNVITLSIVESHSGRTINKRVPKQLSIQTLQGLALKLFKSDGATMPRLCYVDAKHKDIRVNLENLSKNLEYYSIHDGDTILIEYG